MGANTSVTHKNHLLVNYKDIAPYPVGGVGQKSFTSSIKKRNEPLGIYQKIISKWTNVSIQKNTTAQS